MASTPGATDACSSWAPRVTSNCASTPTSPPAKGGNHLYIVDKKQARYIDCNKVPLPFGPQFVRDVVERSRCRAEPGAGAARRRAGARRRRRSRRGPSAPEQFIRGEIMKQFRAALFAALLAVRRTARPMNRPGPLTCRYHASGIYALGETVGWNVTLPWSAPARELRDPQEQSHGDRPRRRQARDSRRRSKPGWTSPAWCMSKSPRTRRTQSPRRSAPRWRRRRSQPSIPAPGRLRRLLEGEDRGAAQGARETRAHAQAQ